MRAVEKKEKQQYILYDAEAVANPELLGFEPEYWASRSAIVGFAEGRGTTFFIQYEGEDYVLRHYRRGGQIARLSPDAYLWTGLRRSRAWREWHLLAWMRELGLPVPRPIAARVVREGLTYRADIMTRRIPRTTTLTDTLEREALDAAYWIALGHLLRVFHRHGIWHADLNANNILLDTGGRFYLIDFDRGRRRRPARHWQQANLQRLQRSLFKQQAKVPQFFFRPDDWQALLQGYASAGLSGD